LTEPKKWKWKPKNIPSNAKIISIIIFCLLLMFAPWDDPTYGVFFVIAIWIVLGFVNSRI
jgi:hypothetical protein